MVSRREFIEKYGATCANWNWSWSFVNHQKRFVIFGLWRDFQTAKLGLILHSDWQLDNKNRKKPGYTQAIEHIRLIEQEGYGLKTFPMAGVLRNPEKGLLSASQITAIKPELIDARLIVLPDGWYASHTDDNFETIPETVDEEFWEGESVKIAVNGYERNSDARRKCIEHYGAHCQACGVDFGKKYGPLGQGYIHVHHIKPIHECGGAYMVDPVKDLIPVCANCHAMIHRRTIPLTVEDLRAIMQTQLKMIEKQRV